MGQRSYIRRMRAPEILTAALSLYRKHFLQLTAVCAAVPLANLLNNLYTQRSRELSQFLLSNGLGLLTIVLVLLPYPILMAAQFLSVNATLVATSNAVLGRRVSLREAYAQVLTPSLIGRSLLLTLLFMAVVLPVLGVVAAVGIFLPVLLLVIVPLLIYLFIRLNFPYAALLLERAGVRESVRRSLSLTDGEAGFIFNAAYVHFGIPVLILSAILTLLIGDALGITFYVDYLVLFGTQPYFDFEAFFGVYSWVAAAMAIVTGPIANLIFTLTYYHLRVVKDRYNESMLAAEIGIEPLSELATA